MEMKPGMPSTIGVIGVGTMSSAMVRGLCSASLSPAPKFVISPRNAGKAAALASEFPDVVTVATTNQDVINACDCVILAVLPKQAEEVITALSFREGQQILSVIATVPLDRLQRFVAPASECVICTPLPAVAKRQGATISMPQKPFAEAICSALGSYIPVEDAAHFRRMQSITGLMGDFYKRQLTAQEWLVSNGVDESRSAAWVGAIFKVMAVDSAEAQTNTFAKLVSEQTPGGLNEMVWKNLQADGSYDALVHSLDSAYHRFSTGQVDPELAPARKRAKQS